jgi:hypothetical protein
VAARLRSESESESSEVSLWVWNRITALGWSVSASKGTKPAGAVLVLWNTAAAARLGVARSESRRGGAADFFATCGCVSSGRRERSFFSAFFLCCCSATKAA